MLQNLKFCLVFILCISPAFGALSSKSQFMRSKKHNPNLLCIAAGDYNILHTKSSHNAAMIQLEFKGPDFFGEEWVKIRPFAAFLVNFQGSVWGGAGVNFDLFPNKPLVLTLGIGPGLYARGNGKNLGYPLEIRSSIEIAYQFKSHARVGFQFYHLSNASFSSKNPGNECLLLFYGIPL
jgi:hypothetical protein